MPKYLNAAQLRRLCRDLDSIEQKALKRIELIELMREKGKYPVRLYRKIVPRYRKIVKACRTLKEFGELNF